METITQTNRTILFAEVNAEKLNLLTLIGDVRGKSSLDDDKIREINEELVVSDFEEFLETVDYATMIEETAQLIAPYVEKDPSKLTESDSDNPYRVDASAVKLSDMGSMDKGKGAPTFPDK